MDEILNLIESVSGEFPSYSFSYRELTVYCFQSPPKNDLVWETAVHRRLFVLSFFPLDILDEIWNVIKSVSEGFPTYSCSANSFEITPLCLSS